MLWYALNREHPSFPIVDKIGKSIFPPKDRKTKRSPDETGKICFSDSPITPSLAFFETLGCRGSVYIKAKVAGGYTPMMTGQFVEVREGVSFGPFLRRKIGPAVHAEGRGIPPEGTEPAQTADGGKKRKPATGRTTARRNRATRFPWCQQPSTKRYRMRVCRVRKIEEEQRLTESEPICWRPSLGTDAPSGNGEVSARHVDTHASQGRQLVASGAAEKRAPDAQIKNSGSHSRSYRPRDRAVGRTRRV